MLSTLQILREAGPAAPVSPSMREKSALFISYEQQVVSHFGLEFMDKMERAWDSVHTAEVDRAYETSFLAAFRLWAEVQTLLP